MQTVTDQLEQNYLKNYRMLNAAQKEAVDTTEGPVMVIAGPGTGKTQILAMRIATILRNQDLQVNPSNILCLTFTESGVSAMRNRLISIIGEAAYYVRIHTFHSFCNEIIKENPHKFFSINSISELEQISIFNKIIEKMEATSPIKPFGDIYIYRNDLITAVKTLKRESINPDQLLEKIITCEKFIEKNSNLIEVFIARNARSIKDYECEEFLEKLCIANLDSEFTTLFKDFWAKASKVKEFKDPIKNFYEKNLREIPKQKELVKVYRAYEKELLSNKLYDFEDMILRVLNQFKNDDELLGCYQEQFQYILVDEFQDTNGAQNKILEYLTAGIEAKINPDSYQKNPNIFVVGDDDQSIYRFQGASVENIVYFLRRYEDHVKSIVLDKNYRSQQKILDTAQSSINKNDSRISKLVSYISKQLSSSGRAAELEHCPVEIHESRDLENEVFHIAQKIKELINQGVKASEIAIFFRENKEAKLLIDYLSKLGLNTSFEGGDNILEDIEICQLIDLLKVIERPERSDLLFKVLNYDFIFESECFRSKKITALDIFKLNETRRSSVNVGLEGTNKSFQEETSSLINYLLEDPKFKAFAQKILDTNRLNQNLRVDNLLERVVKDFNYLDYALKQNDYIQRINKLEALFNEIRSLIDSPLKKYLKRDKTAKIVSLHELIQDLELIQNENLKIKSKALDLDIDAIKLMTAHKSKGLEFEYIFIHSCLNKRWGNKVNRSKLKLPPLLIPETESLINNDDNEDERRLFYVALTRAKKKAFVYYHSENEKGQETVPSLFVTEIASLPNDIVIKHKDGSDETNLKQRLEIKFSDRIDRSIEQEKSYIDSLLENYKLSVTHLNNFIKCKRLFFYQNLLKVPAAKSKHASYGTAVHEALFDLFNNQDKASLDYLLKSFTEHLEKQNLTEQEHKDSLGTGIKALTDYYNKYWEAANKNVLLEYDLSSAGLNHGDIRFTGKLDKIEILDKKNKVIVVDYKTGNPGSKSAELKPGGNYHRQIVFYQLLCNLAKEKIGFKYEMLTGEIDFIQKDSYGKFHKRKIDVDKSDLEILKKEIEEMHQELKAHNFCKTEDIKACSNCDYKNICGR